MSDQQSDAEDILQQSKDRRRTTAAPSPSQAEEAAIPQAVADAFESMDEGETHPNVTFRDERLSALFHGLDEADQIDELVEKAADHLDRDPDGAGRSAAARLLLRVGIQEVAPEVQDEWQEGFQMYLERQASSANL